MSRQKTSRNDEMKKLRSEELLTLQEIADKYGISKERVRQIIGNSGRGIIRKRREEEILGSSEMGTKALAEQLNLSPHTVYGYRKHSIYNTKGGFGKKLTCSRKLMEKIMDLGILSPSESHIGKVGSRIELIINGFSVETYYASHKSRPPSAKGYPYYRFAIRREADFHVFYLADIEEFFVVPGENLPNTEIHIVWPPTNGSYITKRELYRNNFELLRR